MNRTRYEGAAYRGISRLEEVIVVGAGMQLGKQPCFWQRRQSVCAFSSGRPVWPTPCRAILFGESNRLRRSHYTRTPRSYPSKEAITLKSFVGEIAWRDARQGVRVECAQYLRQPNSQEHRNR
jgi:hypothetical protein